MDPINQEHDKSSTSPTTSEAAFGLATANYARSRPKHIPRHTSDDYLDHAVNRDTALRTAIHHLEQELGAHSTISHISLGTDTLTLHPHTSQSKLSAQELSDLQKATHFDKKELQQWYKGETILQSKTTGRDTDCDAGSPRRSSRRSISSSSHSEIRHPLQIMSSMYSTQTSPARSTSKSSSAL
jgi:hypothetical protein